MTCDCTSELSDKDPGERVILTFNYVDALATGETISSVSSVSIVTVGGTDASPATIQDGSPAININSLSIQLPVARGLNNVTYGITVYAGTSLSQTLACYGELKVRSMSGN